ncbi:helix-turn-helix domain-containing protein [Halobacillus mangrovi]|uniref:helix-turn-helix domain-containing protein n=1 Tax=Halobacillus mangrovi TaxID=402384 RepID=UPI003D980427
MTDQNQLFSTMIMEEIDATLDHPDLDLFFEAANQIVEDMKLGNEENAINSLLMVNRMLAERAPNDLYRAYRNFYIALISNFFQNTLEWNIPRSRVFAYNAASIDYIERHTTPDKLKESMEFLISYFSNIVKEWRMPASDHPMISQAYYIISAHLEKSITIQDIAKELEISSSHLARKFKEQTGKTLKKVINEMKVSASVYYLQHSKRPIADISNQFVFCNQSYYTKKFKDQFGVTPKQYRKQYQQNTQLYPLSLT